MADKGSKLYELTMTVDGDGEVNSQSRYSNQLVNDKYGESSFVLSQLMDDASTMIQNFGHTRDEAIALLDKWLKENGGSEEGEE